MSRGAAERRALLGEDDRPDSDLLVMLADVVAALRDGPGPVASVADILTVRETCRRLPRRPGGANAWEPWLRSMGLVHRVDGVEVCLWGSVADACRGSTPSQARSRGTQNARRVVLP